MDIDRKKKISNNERAILVNGPHYIYLLKTVSKRATTAFKWKLTTVI